MTRQNKIAEILKVWSYKSGEDSCNSVYLGSMEKGSVLHILGSTYASNTPIEELLDTADDAQVSKVHRKLNWIIVFMNANVVTTCPHCGGLTGGQ